MNRERSLFSRSNLILSCPQCGSDEFSLQVLEEGGRTVKQTCKVCGLTCQVVVEPESPSLHARVSEWAAVFAQD